MRPREVKVTDVFEKNYLSQAPIVINRGGARSSKSYSIAQRYIQKFVSYKNRKILITRKTFPALRLSAYRLVINLLSNYGYLKYFRHSKVEHSLENPFNNNLMVFTSVDDPEKIKSTEWNDIWMEEATEFTFEDFQLLRLRLSGPSNGHPNQMTLSFNPVDAFHWIKTEILDKGREFDEIPSTFLDNPFLEAGYIKILMDLKREDPNYWKIYGEGEWGILEGLIYSNWIVAQRELWPKDFREVIYGLDFGFNHPSALIELGLVDGEVYERELLYESGLTNSDLIERMEGLIPDKNRYVYADESEPARIEEISRAGFNVWGSNKSVKDGIDYVKRKKIIIHPDSVNIVAEKRSYKWKEHKTRGTLDEPVKYKDDLQDAERYGLYTFHLSHEASSGDTVEGVGEMESAKGEW